MNGFEPVSPARNPVPMSSRNLLHQLTVVAHIWTKRKQPWLTIEEPCPSRLEGAPQAELFRLIDARVAGLSRK